jgi:sulfate adenylyltransferase
MIMDDPRTKLVGRRLWVCRSRSTPSTAEFMLSPREMRTLHRRRAVGARAGVSDPQPLHRAHEYALVAGVERSPRRATLPASC